MNLYVWTKLLDLYLVNLIISIQVDNNLHSLTHCGLGDFHEILVGLPFKPITVIGGWDTCCEIAPRRMSLDLTGDKSTLVQVMAWSGNKPLPEPMLTQISVAVWRHYRPQWVNCIKVAQAYPRQHIRQIVISMAVWLKKKSSCLDWNNCWQWLP